MRLFLCGDVMTGRGIDQVLPHPCDPQLYEPYVRSALGYVTLAEREAGPIERPVALDHIWGDALGAIDRRRPDVRIINLETSVTDRGVPEHKGINYRMHPKNMGCLLAARIDCCVLANNHVLDWGQEGFADTLAALEAAGIAAAGAGRNAAAAARPAIFEPQRERRLLVFAFASPSSGVPHHWAAHDDRPGVNFLADFGAVSLERCVRDIAEWKRPDDLVVASIHWGPNWGYTIPPQYRLFAHSLIERAGVDLVHGHSSHHPMAIEVHDGKPIFYGCGDFVNDYEGIRGHEEFRPDLALAYFAEFDGQALRQIEMLPYQMRRFRLNAASATDTAWVRASLSAQCRSFGHDVEITKGGALRLVW